MPGEDWDPRSTSKKGDYYTQIFRPYHFAEPNTQRYKHYRPALYGDRLTLAENYTPGLLQAATSGQDFLFYVKDLSLAFDFRDSTFKPASYDYAALPSNEDDLLEGQYQRSLGTLENVWRHRIQCLRQWTKLRRLQVDFWGCHRGPDLYNAIRMTSWVCVELGQGWTRGAPEVAEVMGRKSEEEKLMIWNHLLGAGVYAENIKFIPAQPNPPIEKILRRCTDAVLRVLQDTT
ncbi:uncharacterized protein F4822DRAFT_430842 [Hypoxylon trugodes]|uniref:uncharacterized protein n=1 Tax=Hypoxylon trugodes TaxID=326681 RepID=UPI002192DCFE|nr:uncharacterized protein F4822DRAFT_430842 [Hypoxylon trugodes]KAI1388088.1 hypothetical protein F4822DRAFT_430842 [Hypoxylon trugodes]